MELQDGRLAPETLRAGLYEVVTVQGDLLEGTLVLYCNTAYEGVWACDLSGAI